MCANSNKQRAVNNAWGSREGLRPPILPCLCLLLLHTPYFVLLHTLLLLQRRLLTPRGGRSRLVNGSFHRRGVPTSGICCLPHFGIQRALWGGKCATPRVRFCQVVWHQSRCRWSPLRHLHRQPTLNPFPTPGLFRSRAFPPRRGLNSVSHRELGRLRHLIKLVPTTR